MSARWLVKTEPAQYSYADLAREGHVTWDGVSNALALLHLRAMAPGDLVLVYHTGKEKSVVGLARVTKGPSSGPAKPATARAARSVVVDFEPVAAAKKPVTLAWMRVEPRCKDLPLLRMSRLSVMPVDVSSWECLLHAAGLATA